MVIRAALKGLDFNGLVQAIQQVTVRAGGELLGLAMRAVERTAQAQTPSRGVNRGQQTRRLRIPWGQVSARRTRVRDRRTGKTYNLADRPTAWLLTRISQMECSRWHDTCVFSL
ncbi:MAG: hypothetical protein KAY37_01345 [Phycisphaerae bacterium]|nr:hypothetical protein [Phycisphaerae bacterium]